MAISNIGLQEIHLDISTKLRQKTFYANEVDTEGRGLHAFLQDNGVKVDGTGVTMQFRYKSLNDGESKVYDFTPIGDATNGEFELHYPSEMVRGHGNKLFPCTIVARDFTSELAFENVFVYVNKAEVNTEGVEASNEYSSLKVALDKVDTWDSTFEAKYTGLETTYATDLTTVKSQLADMTLNVKKFGAKGDNTTDDTTAVKNAIVSLLAGQTLFFPTGSYLITEPLIIPNDINLKMDGTIIYDGVKTSPALTIGINSINNNHKKLEVRISSKVQSDWLDENYIGVKFINSVSCEITVFQSDKFTIGVQFMGSGGGFSYNNVYLYRLYDNKISVDCTNGNTGWCNENNYFGGRLTNLTGTNTALSRYGIRITSKDGTYKNNNNNVFIKPSIELKVPTIGEAIPILIEHGNNNSFLAVRNETNSTITARILNDSTENIVKTGYGIISIEDLSTSPVTLSESIRFELMNDIKNEVFRVNSMHKKACYADGATQVNIPNVHIAASSSAVATRSHTGITLNADYVEVSASRGIGIFANTTGCKSFVVRRDAEVANPGRVLIRCYNSSGVVLTDLGVNQPYVKGNSIRPFVYNSAFGGAYRIGSDTGADIYFTVGTDVAYICVIIAGVTSPLRIRSFSISALNSVVSTWTGYEELIEGMNLGTVPPTAGTWAVGKRILNALPTVGQPKGWVCTVAGSPGTWVSEGNL